MVTQKRVPQFTSDFGEPQWQSLPARWGIVGFWSHTAIAHTSKCVGTFGSKKMMQILKSQLTDTGSWFSSLCPLVFLDGLFKDEAVECESLALL